MKDNTREISILKQRILQFLDFKGVSKYECYKNTGITNGVLSQSNGMSEDNLLKFLSYYKDISLEWLLYGKGDMSCVQHESEPKSLLIKQVLSERETVYYEMLKEKESELNELLRENGRLEERLKQLESNQDIEKSTNKNSSISCKPKKDVVGSVSAPLKSTK